MAIKASDIKDEESLREWLEGQSVDVARVIAARAALRVFPIALSIHQENHPKLTVEIKNDLTLQSFRANFISWVARKYSTHDIKDAAAAYAAAIAADAAIAAAAASAGAAARSVYAAASAGAAARSVYAAATGAAATNDAAATAARTAAAAAYAAYAAPADAAVRGDAEWLENNPDDIDAMINQPLWLEPSYEPENYVDLKNEIKKTFEDFLQSDLAQNTSFGLIADWYAALLPEKGKPRSLFGEKKDLLLATQSRAFWRGETQEVMDRVAELVGWPEDYRKQEDEKTDKDEQAKSEKFSKAKAEKVSSNRMAVRLQLSAIVNSIAIEKEFIGEQPNEEEKQEDWLNKTQFLEGLDKMANDALDLLPIKPDGTQNEKDDEVASLLSEYAQEFENWLRKNKSEVVDSVMRLGSAAGFTSVFYLVGGYMPLATPLIFGITCKEQALNILRVLKSSVSKKKPKDKDE